MYARRRFALPSVGPALENVGVIVVLGRRGADLRPVDRAAPHGAPVGELVLLGAGLHGRRRAERRRSSGGEPRRCGVPLFPTWGWRDETLRAGAAPDPALGGLRGAAGGPDAARSCCWRAGSSGGAVALQVALQLLRAAGRPDRHPDRAGAAARALRAWSTRARPRCSARPLARGLASALFLAAPAAVGYVLLAASDRATWWPPDRWVRPAGRAMISGSLAALALGLVGQTVCFVSHPGVLRARGHRSPRCGAWSRRRCGCLVLCGGAVVLWDATALVQRGRRGVRRRHARRRSAAARAVSRGSSRGPAGLAGRGRRCASAPGGGDGAAGAASCRWRCRTRGRAGAATAAGAGRSAA